MIEEKKEQLATEGQRLQLHCCSVILILCIRVWLWLCKDGHGLGGLVGVPKRGDDVLHASAGGESHRLPTQQQAGECWLCTADDICLYTSLLH